MVRGEDWEAIRKIICYEDVDITYTVVNPWPKAVIRA